MYNMEMERTLRHYASGSYLEDVKSHSDLLDFQKQLFRDLSDGSEVWKENEDSKKYLRKILECIKTKKVLVVIDDVGTEQNLKALHVLALGDRMDPVEASVSSLVAIRQYYQIICLKETRLRLIH